jgi:hypothetical protein
MTAFRDGSDVLVLMKPVVCWTDMQDLRTCCGQQNYHLPYEGAAKSIGRLLCRSRVASLLLRRKTRQVVQNILLLPSGRGPGTSSLAMTLSPEIAYRRRRHSFCSRRD